MNPKAVNTPPISRRRVLHKFTATLTMTCAGAVRAAALKPAGFDASTLSRENFLQVLEPVAQREGRLVFYNFAGTLDPVWKEGLIPRFTQRYGVKVEYHNVRRDQANQQLISIHKAGMPSPVDVYFAGGPDNYALLRASGVIAPFNLSRLLPNLQAVPPQYKDVVFGVDTGGAWPIVNRNQVALAYDSASLPTAQVPTSFDELLTWAEKNPKRFAITSPAKGGSGGGFLYSAALHFVTEPQARKALRDARMTNEQVVRWARDAVGLDPLWRYLTRLLKVAELTNGNADTLNLINNRQVWIGTAWEDQVMTFVRSGQLPPTMRLTLLRKGMVASGDGLIVTANARSPAAALLFIDMAFGKEFQIWKLEHHASRSPRSDIDAATVVSADAARFMLPQAQLDTLSLLPNWTVTHGLQQVFEDNILSRL
jgi:multiple sugar transport system substrate-binding protein/putative spermidine/putrescine transport system substrate-binding protein